MTNKIFESLMRFYSLSLYSLSQPVLQRADQVHAAVLIRPVGLLIKRVRKSQLATCATCNPVHSSRTLDNGNSQMMDRSSWELYFWKLAIDTPSHSANLPWSFQKWHCDWAVHWAGRAGDRYPYLEQSETLGFQGKSIGSPLEDYLAPKRQN